MCHESSNEHKQTAPPREGKATRRDPAWTRLWRVPGSGVSTWVPRGYVGSVGRSVYKMEPRAAPAGRGSGDTHRSRKQMGRSWCFTRASAPGMLLYFLVGKVRGWSPRRQAGKSAMLVSKSCASIWGRMLCRVANSNRELHCGGSFLAKSKQ